MKVIVAGAGIGGLVTALMLHARGIACEVYEQAETVRELGVGINVLPHAIAELDRLGLLPQLDAIGIRTRELIYATAAGQPVWQEPRGIDAGFEVPQFSIHRGRLQGAIYQAVLERLGPGAVRPGARLAAWEQDAHGVTAQFVDRTGAVVADAAGDVLIGADGIHSVVRGRFYPGEGPPSWNGIMLWRGATDWPVFLDGRTMIIAGGMAAKAVVYPIAPGIAPGTRLTNWAIAVTVGGRTLPRREDWSRRGDPADLAPHVGRFTLPQLDLPGLIAATPEFWEYPMCDRDPLPWWSEGRVTLLGDAAHPMYPVGSNGASQAILDARCLADCLADCSAAGTPDAALLRYEAERRPKTAAIVQSNRVGGPEGVIDVVEQRAPNGFADLDAVLPHAAREAIVRGYAQQAGFQPERDRR